MQISILIDEDDGPEQAKRAMSVIGFFMGAEVMAKVAGEYRANMAPPPPPAADDAEDEETPSPPASIAFAPPAPAAPLAPHIAAELDSEGLPYDARIHSSSKNKTQKGAWKFARNLDENTKMAVLAELRAKYPAAHAAPAAAPPPPAADIPASLDRRVAPPPPAPTPAPAAPPSDGGYTFVTLMQRITENLGAGKLTRDEVAAACKSAGLSSPAELGMPANAVHIPTVAAFIDATVMTK